MSKTHTRVEITEPCFVEGELAEQGEVIDVLNDDASHMIGNGRAKHAAKDAKVGKPEAKEVKK